MGFCGLNKQTCLQRCKFHKECQNRLSCLLCFRWKCFVFFHHTVAHLSYCVWLNTPESHFTIWSKSHLDEKQRRKANRTAEERSKNKVGVKGRARPCELHFCCPGCAEKVWLLTTWVQPLKGVFLTLWHCFLLYFRNMQTSLLDFFFFFLDIV